MPAPTAAVAALRAAALTCAAVRLRERLPAAARSPWERTNHAGASVSLLEGPAIVGGLAVDAAVRRDPAALAAVLGSGATGTLDDLRGSAQAKGFRGHLRALSRGQVTTGVVKIAGIGATGLVAAALAARSDLPRQGSGIPSRLALALARGAVVAGAANAINLFDLRPGRAAKVVSAAALPLALAGAPDAAAVVGAAAGAAPDDLAGRTMMGDTGANPLGAALGLAVARRMGLPGNAIALTGLGALMAASEKVSFTKVIEANPVLHRIDMWGRGAS